MTPSPFSEPRRRRPATGVPGAARPRPLLGWGGAPGALPGVASARLVAGTLTARPLREGLAACGQPSTVGGGRGGGEPFYLDGCGCGGACGRGASCACPGCAAGDVRAPAAGPGGTRPVRGELAELPDDLEPPPGWDSPFSARWSLLHWGPVGLPEPGEGNSLTPRGGEGEGNSLTPRWVEGEENQFCACETPRLALRGDVRDGNLPLLYDCHGSHAELVRHAWQMLLDNRRLLTEALWRYEGDNLVDEVDDLLNNAWGYAVSPVHVVCDDLFQSTAGYTSWGAYDSITFVHWDNTTSELWLYGRRLRLDTDYLDQLALLWDAANAATGRLHRKGRACPVVDLAATIAHELVHALGYSGNDRSDTGRSSYEVENYLRYYLSRWYCVLGWGCCNWVNADSNTGDTCGNFDCLVGNPGFNSDTYRIDFSSAGEETDAAGNRETNRHNACVGTGACAH